MPNNLQASMALTPRKGDAASVRRQSRQRLRSERRYIFSRAAALCNERRYTPYFGACHFNDALYESAVSAGPGCPLPYSTPRSAGFFSIVPYSPGKIHPAGKKLLLSVKSMEKRLKTGPFCETINLYQNECTARRRGLHLHTDTTILGGKHHECSRDHGKLLPDK